MEKPRALIDFESLNPGPSSAGWLAALIEHINAPNVVQRKIGAVRLDPDDVKTARLALLEWSNGLAPSEPRRLALAQDHLHWLLRPALRISRNSEGATTDEPAPPVWGNFTPAIRELVRVHSPSVARLDVSVAGVRTHVGTAWVVGRSQGSHLLLTARHVVRQARDLGGWSHGRVVLDFGCLDGPSPVVVEAAAPKEHPKLDLAMVHVPSQGSSTLRKLPWGEPPKDTEDCPLLVLGHPVFAPGPSAVFATTTVGFDGVTGVKRASPGKFKVQTVNHDNEAWSTAFSHDATTLGGNSGSPVFRLDTGKVVGVHVGGVAEGVDGVSWFSRNCAIPLALPPEDAFLAALRAASEEGS